jgi:hypothetical protein
VPRARSQRGGLQASLQEAGEHRVDLAPLRCGVELGGVTGHEFAIEFQLRGLFVLFQFRADTLAGGFDSLVVERDVECIGADREPVDVVLARVVLPVFEVRRGERRKALAELAPLARAEQFRKRLAKGIDRSQ